MTAGKASESARSTQPFVIGSKTWPGLSKLTEECGEVLQVVGKLMATGGASSHWDGSDLHVRFVAELADLQAAIDYVTVWALTNPERGVFERRRRSKGDLFRRWHRNVRLSSKEAGDGQGLKAAQRS